MVDKLGLDEESVSVGWGYRPSGRAASLESRAGNGQLLLLEDAFVRSMKPAVGQIYGLVADSKGIYYDASGESDLITALDSGEATGWMRPGPGNWNEAETLLERFRTSRVSKYNWYPGDFRGRPLLEKPSVIVVDQTKGDASHHHGGMDAGDFDRMVRDALDEHPSEMIYLRAHPDHRYRGKHSCFSPWVFEEARVKLLPADLSPAACFEFCKEVYTGTSLMGMEGLIHGCRVKTYGWNFYAGWGLTEDRCEGQIRARGRQLDLVRLFEAAYLQYSHYFDPDSGEPCSLDRILDHLELQRRIAAEDAGLRITVGWTPWNRGLAEGFFRSPGVELCHADSMKDAETMAEEQTGVKLILWGASPVPDGTALPLIRVEDGFLRSSGLGAKFHRPVSWVLDDLGIYFDPRKPSRLEVLLQEGIFPQKDMEDAENLLCFLRQHRLTKYNVGENGVNWSRELAGGRKVVLVPGQVEADASIKHGSPEVQSNSDLLLRVREAEPAAFLIFKAHPDLVAGARQGQVLPQHASHLADLVVTGGNVLSWLDLCDEVHTMTSTLGFEAVIRGVAVVTYGLPFYAGWGLTTDRLNCPRRTRQLSLCELVCGALILYPRYLNPFSGEFTSAIHVAELLANGKLGRERPAWYLQAISILKHGWVKATRHRRF